MSGIHDPPPPYGTTLVLLLLLLLLLLLWIGSSQNITITKQTFDIVMEYFWGSLAGNTFGVVLEWFLNTFGLVLGWYFGVCFFLWGGGLT